jgi:hypothetical protein
MAYLDQLKIHGGAEVSVLEVQQPDRHVLAVLSLLMGFVSISTDLYLPTMPAPWGVP